MDHKKLKEQLDKITGNLRGIYDGEPCTVSIESSILLRFADILEQCSQALTHGDGGVGNAQTL